VPRAPVGRRSESRCRGNKATQENTMYVSMQLFINETETSLSFYISILTNK